MVRIRRLIKSFTYALKGLKRTFIEEQNFQIQTIAAIFVVILGLYFRISRTEWCFIIFTIGTVMLMELANSAVERVADILKPRIHDYVKEIKDIMAAAVFLASMSAVIIGLIIFLPHISKALGL
jgi:undecaprenol kinase